MPPTTIRERLEAAVGSLIGLAIVGAVGRLALGQGSELSLLIAPLGAAAVLLFAVPESPLARPWPVLGGNFISAMIGVACAKLIADVTLATAVACALAIAAMMLADCLHPPGGAVALTAVLGGPAIQGMGFGFALWPVAIATTLLLLSSMAFKKFRQQPQPVRVASGEAAFRQPIN